MDSVHSFRFRVSVDRSIGLGETYRTMYRSNFSEEKKLTIRSLEYLAGHSQLPRVLVVVHVAWKMELYPAIRIFTPTNRVFFCKI